MVQNLFGTEYTGRLCGTMMHRLKYGSTVCTVQGKLPCILKLLKMTIAKQCFAFLTFKMQPNQRAAEKIG
jgi:hypothetical protein